MPNSLSAKKRVRQNAKRASINRWRKNKIRVAVKDFLATVTQGDAAKAGEQLQGLYKLLDQIAASKTIHKNAAARTKSRLTARLNQLKATKEAA